MPGISPAFFVYFHPFNEQQMAECKNALRQTGVFTEQDRNHVLITIYEKSSLSDYIEKTVDKGRILHKKEGLHQTRQAGLQLAGAVSEETLNKKVAQFNKKVKEFKKENNINYSTPKTDSISNRHLQENAFEGISRSSVEYGMIQDYKQNTRSIPH